MTHEEQRRQALEAGIQRVGVGECWLWHGLRYAGNRCPCIVIGDVVQSAHIAMWEMVNGEPVPADRVVRKSCQDTECLNPAHMVLREKRQRRSEA